MLPADGLCKVCGHSLLKHHDDLGLTRRCDSCPEGLCVNGEDGQRYRAMIGATSQLLGGTVTR